MKAADKLRKLAEVTSYQWGMITTAQSARLGITRLDLSRLTEAGHLTRLELGVYIDAGAPGTEIDDLRAAWLSTEPKRLAEERLGDYANGVVIASESAARLHKIGDFRALKHNFVAPVRRQSQRPEIRYRQRVLDAEDVTIVGGLPVMTIERTIADLVEDVKDLSLVADTLRDAVMRSRSVDFARLMHLLAPLADRNGFRRGDGGSLLEHLKDAAGLNVSSLAQWIAEHPVLGSMVTARVLAEIAPYESSLVGVNPEVAKVIRPFLQAASKSPVLRQQLAEQAEIAALPLPIQTLYRWRRAVEHEE